MKCEEVSLLINEFYDGELDSFLKSGVGEHIAACSLCSASFEKVARLDQLLEKSSVPPPSSAMLDQKLMEAFERQHKKASTSPAWWQRIFVGSLSIPKPAFAAILIVFAIALTAANLIGRYSVLPSDFNAISNVPSPVVTVPLPPEIIEETKIVEVPVIHERVVTRVVYVERKSIDAIKEEKSMLVQNGTEGNKPTQTVKEENSNLAMNGAVEEGGYITRANLLGFQPPAELKTRIIREDKTNEK